MAAEISMQELKEETLKKIREMALEPHSGSFLVTRSCRTQIFPRDCIGLTGRQRCVRKGRHASHLAPNLLYQTIPKKRCIMCFIIFV
jgi:hypothetical protein